MRFSLDSNILVYAIDTLEPVRQQLAARLIARAALADCILTAQTIGEFLNVVRRKQKAELDFAIELTTKWATVFPVFPSTPGQMIAAAQFADRHRLQFWDSVIWQCARANGAHYLLSEDMQDGITIDGLTLVNPLERKNDTLVESLLKPPP